jgi:hypothetical protein
LYLRSIRPDEATLQASARDVRLCLVDAGASIKEGLAEQEIVELMNRDNQGVAWQDIFACFDLVPSQLPEQAADERAGWGAADRTLTDSSAAAHCAPEISPT